MKSDPSVVALIAVMALVGGAGWWFQLRPELRVEPSRLMTLPLELDGYTGTPVALETTVESILQADYNLQRLYGGVAPRDLVWLYIGYYGTQRGGQPEHTPSECYPSAGWAIESDRTVTLDEERGLAANEYIVARESERRLVYFWYRSHRSTGMLGSLGMGFDRLRGRLSTGRADGALVRVSTPVSPGLEERSRERLSSFARRLDPLLDEHWPMEFPAG